MSDQVGFVTQGAAQAVSGEIPTVGIGMVGYAFMGKAHTNGYKKIPYIFWPPAAIPRLVSIAGRNEQAVSAAAQRFGFARFETDWHATVTDPGVQIVDNTGPNNLHSGPTLAAIAAGKHVICEKPLG